MKNKIINFALAATMVVSSLAGLAMTATAESEPAYADWTLNEATYTELFEGDISEVTNNGWTLSRADALVDRGNEVSFSWNRWMQYNNSTVDGAFYYTYKIRMYNSTEDAQVVKLVGTNEYTVLASPVAVGGAYTFTTVVDTASNKAYTYNTADSTLISTTDITDDAISGIKFQNTVNTDSSNGFYVYDFYYGTVATEEDTQGTPEPTPEPTAPEYSDWNKIVSYTETFDNGASDISSDWTLSRADALTNRSSAVSFDWNRWVQYNNSADTGAYYYTYKIQMYNSTEGAQLVKLVGADEYTVLASPVAVGATYEFTTVVDPESGMAYTYDYNGELISSVNITGDTITGIKFQNTVNTNSNNGFWIYDFYYGTIAANAEEPTINAAEAYDSTEDEAGFVATFTAEAAVSSLTWYIDVNSTGYQKLTDDGVLPQIAQGSTVKIGLIVSGLTDSNLTADDLAAGYTVQ